MVAPVFSTDLITLTDADSSTGFTEPTGATAGGNPVLETDYFLQGTNCITKSMNATGLAGLAFTNGTNITFTGNTVFYIWNFFGAPNSISTKDLGGIQVIVGNSAAAYFRYYVNGSDTYTYGGWTCYVINPNFTPRSGTAQGTPNGNWATFGMVVNNLNALGQGRPFAVDAIRYGRGSIDVWGGDFLNGFIQFSLIAEYNDDISRRLGILQLQDSSYKFQGRLGLGTTTTATNMIDQDVSIVIQNTEFVNSDFNLIEVLNTASNIELSNINIQSLSQQAPGDFKVTDNATVVLNGCNFSNMGYFTFQPNTTVNDTAFRGCKGIIPNNAVLSQCSILNFNTSTAAVVLTTASHVNNITQSTFASGGNHAVDLGTVSSSQSVNWNANTLEFYAAGTAGTFVGVTGSTNSALLTNVSSGFTLTISVINGATIPSIRNTGAGTVIVESNVTIFVSVADVDTNPIVGAQVAIYESNTDEDFLDNEIFNGQTDANGEVTLGYSSNVPIYIRVRKSTSGSTRYKPVETVGNTGASGASFFLTLIEDAFVELTS